MRTKVLALFAAVTFLGCSSQEVTQAPIGPADGAAHALPSGTKVYDNVSFTIFKKADGSGAVSVLTKSIVSRDGASVTYLAGAAKRTLVDVVEGGTQLHSVHVLPGNHVPAALRDTTPDRVVP